MRRRSTGYLLLTLLLICFIWGQSMLPRDVSAQESGHFMRFFKPIFDPDGSIPDDAFHHGLRKAAHFAEYAALSFCLFGTLRTPDRRKWIARLSAAFLAAAAVAAVDETIQLFSDGRGAKLQDVLLDCGGALCGLVPALLVQTLILKKRRSRGSE